MFKKTLEYLANMLGLRSQAQTIVEERPLTRRVILPIEDLRYAAPTSQSQTHVFASVFRAKELAIHLRDKYGDDWMQHVGEVYGEDEEVTYELDQFVKLDIPLQDPAVTMTTDNVPVVMNGFHTVCAYRNLGYKDVRVVLDAPHRKSSQELNLKPFSDITVYLSRKSEEPLSKEI